MDRRDKMNLIFFRYDEKEDVYIPMQAGTDIVPTSVVDKVLPVSENVMRQFEKVIYKNGKLLVREGMELLSDADLDEQDRKSLDIENMGSPFVVEENEIVEVE